MVTKSNTNFNVSSLFSKYIFDPSSKELGRLEQAIAWSVSILFLVGIGIAIKKLSDWTWVKFFKNTTSRKTTMVSSSVLSPSNEDGNLQKVKHYDDNEILKKLKTGNSLINKECGGGGKCLFYSIAHQIKTEEFNAALAKSKELILNATKREPFKEAIDKTRLRNVNCSWTDLNETEKADVLRIIALIHQWEFINGDGFALPTEKVDMWYEELYKDMLQELEVSGFSFSGSKPISDAKLHVNIKKKRKCVKEWFPEYLKMTIELTNDAGSSEMIALSIFFNRVIKAYGEDGVAKHQIQWNDNGELLQYFSFLPSDTPQKPPILIFQCGGGGHYQALIPLLRSA